VPASGSANAASVGQHRERPRPAQVVVELRGHHRRQQRREPPVGFKHLGYGLLRDGLIRDSECA
jgi:hypothetical protein